MRSIPAALAKVALGLALAGLVACPTPRSPSGPPPEYEEPPPPSWLDAGDSAEGGAATDGAAPERG